MRRDDQMPVPTAEIRQAILERGELTKEEILLVWPLGEDDYATLRAELAADREIEPGPKRTGGFRVRQRRWRLSPDAEPAAAELPLEPWQRRGAERLTATLRVAQLDELLGRKLANALRLDRKRRTGRDAPSRLDELAHALVVKHDRDLFADPAVRAAVAKACGVPKVEKWHPGKATAAELVRAVDFPLEFAGLPADETPPPFQYLEGRVALPALEDFQREVRDALLRRLASAGERAIVTLPTGAGKTRTAVETIRDWLTERSRAGSPRGRHTVLWLAHSGELCEQAHESFRHVWQHSEDVCPLLLFRFWAGFTQFRRHQEAITDILKQPSVLVSTPQKIVNLIDDRREDSQDVLQVLLSTVALVVVDEAHRAAAPSYRTILGRFAGGGSDTRVVGLTATPFRKEYQRDGEAGTKELKEVFRRLIEPTRTLGPDARGTLQDRGVLSRPVEEIIDTTTILRAPAPEHAGPLTEEDIERIDYALRIRADKSSRRQTVFEHLLPLCRQPDASILYFGPSVPDAEAMAFLLRRAGVTAAFVGATTRDVSRRRIVAEFKRGGYRVLCNCEVLTTGFDAPRVTHVVVARPTASRVLYEQMIGRGLRGPQFGGTAECVIINCQDDYRTPGLELGYEAFRHLWKVRGRRRPTPTPAASKV